MWSSRPHFTSSVETWRVMGKKACLLALSINSTNFTPHCVPLFMCIPVTGSVSYNPIVKDYSVVCLEAKEAILVNLLTEKSSEFVGIIDSKHVFYLQ